MWLLIDDIRNLNVDAIARTPEAGKKLLELKCWECVCFDHDLGSTETGYDILEWSIERDLLPPRVQLVTDNASGLIKMQRTLKAENYVTKDNRNFFRDHNYEK